MSENKIIKQITNIVLNKLTNFKLNKNEATILLTELEKYGILYKTEMRTVEGYMCKIDFDHELGEARGGNKVYATVEDLKRCHPMWEECGIVKVSVTLETIVDEGEI